MAVVTGGGRGEGTDCLPLDSLPATSFEQFRGHVSLGLFRTVGREIFIRFSCKLPKYAQTHAKCDSPHS